MEFGQTKPQKNLVHILRREAREKYVTLAPELQMLYSNRTCAMCGAHLTIRQLNRIIMQGAPNVCLKDYKKVQGQMEKLAPLMNQITLF